MDNYRKVPKQKNESEQIEPNEIRITSLGIMRRYISYAVALLDPSLVKQFQEEQQADTAENAEKFPTPSQQYDTIVLKAMGRAINKTVTVAEVIKRRVANLHQITLIHSTSIVDEWEPKVEGLDKKTLTRTVSAITITLSKTQLDKKDPGYQEPIPQDQVQPLQPIPHYEDEDRPQRRRRARGKKEGGDSQQQNQQQQSQEGDQKTEGGEQKPKKRRNRRNKPRKQDDTQGGNEQAQQTQQQPQQNQPQQQQQNQQNQQTQQSRPRQPRGPRRDQQQGEQGAVATQGGDQQQGEQGNGENRRGRGGRGRGRGRRGGGRGRGRGDNQGDQPTNATE